MMQDHFACAC